MAQVKQEVQLYNSRMQCIFGERERSNCVVHYSSAENLR